MNPQVLVPGLWFYTEKNGFPYYIGHINVETAMLVRPIVKDSITHTDSVHVLYNYLIGIPLTREIMENNFGFDHSNDKEGYVYKEIRPAIKVTRGDNIDVVKPATYLYIDIDESGKRFTTYLLCGENKIFLPELSFVHEVQLLLYVHTDKFPYLTITQTKSNDKESQ
jgi:hypothetical protein